MRTSLTTLALLIGTGLLACTTTETKTADPAGSEDGGACATSGNGVIKVTVSGLPATVTTDLVTPVVQFKGATDTFVTQSNDLAAPGGSYQASGLIKYAPDPIVRTVYGATVTPASFCLRDDATENVNAVYAAIPSSNKLWTMNANSTSGQLMGFSSAALSSTSTQPATVAVKGGPGRSLAFDKDGNLWTLQATLGDPAIQRYAASTLGDSGAKTPDRTLALDVGCLPGLTEMAFSPSGDLYISSACANGISRIAAADLAASGTPTPNLTLGGLESPQGIAFDKDGNLWVADGDAKTLLRYDAGRLATASTDPANLVITPEQENGADLAPNDLAFDASGNLWVSSFGGNVVYRLSPADLAGTAPKTIVPAVQITLSVSALLEGMAFDESGALWLTLATGSIGRLGASQLGTSSGPGNPTAPEVIITSPDIAYAGAMAFFPPPSGSPLYGH